MDIELEEARAGILQADLYIGWMALRPLWFSSYRMYMTLTGKMSVFLPQVSSGCKSKMQIKVNTSFGGSVSYNFRNSSYTTEIDTLQEKKEIFNLEYVYCTHKNYKHHKFIFSDKVIWLWRLFYSIISVPFS